MGFRHEAREKFRHRPRDWNREPLFPSDDELLSIGARLLNPLEVTRYDGESPLGTTAYFTDSLLIPLADRKQVMGLAEQDALSSLGWRLVEDRDFTPVEAMGPHEQLVGVSRFKLTPISRAEAIERESKVAPVDAWVAVQTLRSLGVERASLEHVLVSTTRGHTSGHTEDEDERPVSGRYRSSGGRLPVAYTGPAPARQDHYPGIRRPVVVVLDTGCGEHQWLRDGVHTNVEFADGNGALQTLGFGAAPEPPDPDGLAGGGEFEGPLDGVIDPFSGHGTFICGLIRQGCPDADILVGRIVPSSGLIRESDLINALAGVVNLIAAGKRVDVVNLSMGYYSETDGSRVGLADTLSGLLKQDPALVELLQTLSSAGVAVVCSAGNDATARPMVPAALSQAAGSQANGGQANGGAWPVPITAVGALNPNRKTVSIRSNTGPWVTTYQPGAHVFSTLPGFNGGYEPTNHTVAFCWPRESVDPDDFTSDAEVGGFGLWNGTSFAAPIQAALILRGLEKVLLSGEPTPDQVADIVRDTARPKP
ncbi:MAG: S8/S53 family peptidase [Nocardioides sp.]